jgi:phage terminase small subunit
MGEITNIDVLKELSRDNPTKRTIDLKVFADALAVYDEAARNVREHGAIVMHPRTGTPIQNPYLKIQTQKGAVLAKMARVKSDRVLSLLGLT